MPQEFTLPSNMSNCHWFCPKIITQNYLTTENNYYAKTCPTYYTPMVYMHLHVVITLNHCCDFTSKCKMGDIIDMQNIRATYIDVANMDEILISIDVET